MGEEWRVRRLKFSLSWVAIEESKRDVVKRRDRGVSLEGGTAWTNSNHITQETCSLLRGNREIIRA